MSGQWDRKLVAPQASYAAAGEEKEAVALM